MHRPQLADAPGVEFCDAEPLDVLWVGDATLAQRFMSRRAPHVRITAHDTLGALEYLRTLKDHSNAALDLIVVDASLPGMNPLQVLATAEAEAVDVPVLLLTEPGQDDLVNKAGRLAVCDCLIKTQDYLHQILYSFTQVRLRHDLVTVLSATRLGEERLKVILETQPAVVCVISADGTISAMNRAGLTMLGLMLEQAVGAPFTTFIPAGEHDAVRQLLRRVCEGELEELPLTLVRSDDSVCSVRMEALPLPRAEGVSVLATFHEHAAPETAAQVAQAQIERDRLQSIVDQMIADRDQAHAQLASVQATREDLEREQAQLREALERASGQCDTHVAEASRLHATIDELRARLDLVETERERLSAELTLSEETRSTIDAERVRLAALAGEAQMLLQTAETERQAERTQWADVVQTIETQRHAELRELRELREQHERITRELTVAQATCEAAVAERRHWETLAQQAEERHLDARNVVDGLQSEQERLNAERAERERQELADRFTNERQAWTERADAREAEHAARVQELQRALTEMERRLEAAEARHATLLAHAQEAHRPADDALRLEAATARCQYLAEELAHAREALRAFESGAARLSSDATTFLTQMAADAQTASVRSTRPDSIPEFQ
jgi:PAS domain S-box-containing protein